MTSGCDSLCSVTSFSELGILASPLREHGNRSVALAELAEERKKLWNADFGVTRDLPDLSVASPCDHSPVRLGPVNPAASSYAVLQKEDLQAAAAERELAAGLKRAFDKSTRSALTLACRSIWERENSAKHRPSMPTTPPCRSTSTVMIGPSLCLSSVFATALSLKRTYTPPDSESISTIAGLATCTTNMCLTELICPH